MCTFLPFFLLFAENCTVVREAPDMREEEGEREAESRRLQEGEIDAAFYRPTTSHDTSASFLNSFFLLCIFRDRSFLFSFFFFLCFSHVIKLTVGSFLYFHSLLWITLIFATRPFSHFYVQTTIQCGGATGMRDKRRGWPQTGKLQWYRLEHGWSEHSMELVPLVLLRFSFLYRSIHFRFFVITVVYKLI